MHKIKILLFYENEKKNIELSTYIPIKEDENENKLFENRGLTLVELILSVAILSIVITFIFTFFNFNYNTFLKSSTKYNIQTNLNQAIRTIEKDLKYADEVSLYPDKEFGGEKTTFI